MKLLFTFVAATFCLNQVCGTPVRRDETEQGAVAVVALVNEFLTSLHNGARLKTVELGAETIIDNVDAILGASETTVTVSDAQDVIDRVVGLISSDDGEEDLKATVDVNLDRAFTLLGALVAELENAIDSGDEKNILSILLAIRITAGSLLETVEELENEIIISYDPDTETDGSRRAVSKRRVCIGIGWKKGCAGIGWDGKRFSSEAM